MPVPVTARPSAESPFSGTSSCMVLPGPFASAAGLTQRLMIKQRAVEFSRSHTSSTNSVSPDRRGSPVIPFNRPYLPPAAFDYMREAVERGKLSGDGHFTHLCEEWMQEKLSAERVLLTTSCTSALEMAMLLLEVGPGDEVIVPSFTFVSCANAVALRGATPVFADIDPVTLCISPKTVMEKISDRTKAVMVVHYAGITRDVIDLRSLCDERGIELVEDTAHAFLSTFHDKPLGTFGSLATLSFHETKNFSMGEGGALIVNDSRFIERAEVIREKGTNRKQFFKGLVDKYSWVDLGSSYVPSELLAAILWAQLEVAELIQADRHRSWNEYALRLRSWADHRGFVLPSTPPGCAGSAHMFQILLDSGANRDRLLSHLATQKIGGVFHYLALEGSPYGSRLHQAPCPVSIDVASRLVRLPLYPFMTDEALSLVVQAVEQFSE